MGHVNSRCYAARDQHDLLRLLAAQPFGWLVSAGGDDAAFTPMPFRALLDEEQQLVGLAAHVARRNAHVARLRRDPAAQVLIIGPHAYVSPSWLDDRTQAPTWNYAAAVFEVRMHVSDEEAAIADELVALVSQMEAGRERAWQLSEMGQRYARLAQGVTALRGEITSTRATFKLGQDEAAHDFSQILSGLMGAGEAPIVDWMRAFWPADGGDA